MTKSKHALYTSMHIRYLHDRILCWNFGYWTKVRIERETYFRRKGQPCVPNSNLIEIYWIFMELRSRNIRPNMSRSFSDTDDDLDDEETKLEESKQANSIDLKKMFIRSFTASLLSLFFLGLLQAGHFYCILLVTRC